MSEEKIAYGQNDTQPLVEEQPTPHVHGPFTFLLNQNHNALRGCTTCGAAWVGSMAGNEENLRWHPVYEVE